MPKKPQEPEDAASPAPAEETLVPFTVIVNGVDRVILATDFADAQRRAAKLAGE